MKPSERAGRDRTALEHFGQVLDASAFAIFGVRVAPQAARDKHGFPVDSIEVTTSTPSDVAAARKRLAAAAGNARTAWERYGRADKIDLGALPQQLGSDAYYGSAFAEDVALAVIEATARAEREHDTALACEKGWFIRPLAWWVRLPDDIAEAAGSNRETAGRRAGRVAQIVTAGVPLAGAAFGLVRLLG